MDKRSSYRLFIITALWIVDIFGVGALTIVPKGALKKGDNVVLRVSSTGTVFWIRNSVTMSTCFVTSNFCDPPNFENMVFSAVSSESNSTMTITGADHGLNGGLYEVAGGTSTLTINSPIAAVEFIEQKIGNTTAILVAEIRCIFPKTELQVTFHKIRTDGRNSSEVLNNNDLGVADNANCTSYESAFNVTKTYDSGNIDETFYVIVCGKHLSLNTVRCSNMSNLITFKGYPTTADSTTKQQSPTNSDQYTSAKIRETTLKITESTTADVAMYKTTNSVTAIKDITGTYSQPLLTQNEDAKNIIIIVVSCTVFAIVLIVVSFLVFFLGKSRASRKGDNNERINKSETRQISNRGQLQAVQNDRSLPLYNYSLHQYRPKIVTEPYNAGFDEYDGNTKTSERSEPHHVDLPDQYQLSITTYQIYRDRNNDYNRNRQFELRPTNMHVQGDFQAFQGYSQNHRQTRTQKQSFADHRDYSRASYLWQ